MSYFAATHLSQKPFFSIITPTFNRPQLLQRAIQSVVTQQFDDLEYIVINDGSSANYDDVIKKNSTQINCYINLTKSFGASFSRNLGIQKAKGQWIVFLDDDDEFELGYLHHLKNYIDNYVTAPAFIWSAIKNCHYDDQGEIVSADVTDYSDVAFNKEKLYERAMIIGTGFGFTVSREAFAITGLFNTTYCVGEDTDLIIRFLKNNIEPHVLPNIGVIVHRHQNLRLSLNYKNYSDFHIYESIYSEHTDFIDKHRNIFVNYFNWSALVHYKNKNYKSGDYMINKMYLRYPFSIQITERFFAAKLLKTSIKHPSFKKIIDSFINIYIKLTDKFKR